MINLSPSQMSTFLTCEQRWFYRYVKNIKIAPSGAITKGKSVHEGIKYNYENKKVSRVDEPIDTILDVFSDVYDENAKETAYTEDENVTEMKNSGVEMLRAYHKIISPSVQPIIVEEKFETTAIVEGVNLNGYIDLVDDKKIIRDTKTSGKKPYQSKIDESLQLPIYQMFYPDATLLQLDVVYGTKNIDTISLIKKVKTPEELESYKELVKIIANRIQSGVYIPKTAGYFCAPKWCGFWNLCKFGRAK